MAIALRLGLAAGAMYALSSCATSVVEPEPPAEPMETPSDQIAVKKVLPPRATRGEVESDIGLDALKSAPKASSQMRITAVDVGAGNCIVVQCPNANEALLVDCGTNDGVHNDEGPDLELIAMRANRASSVIPPLIGQRKVNLVVTHPHGDHMIFVPQVLSGKSVTGIWLGGYLNQYGNNPELPSQYHIRPLLRAQQEAGVSIHADWEVGYDSGGRAESELSCGDAEASILTVNVATDGGSRQNASSLVLLLRYGNFQAIFPGDAEGTTEDDVLAEFSGILKDTSVLFSAHHGSEKEGSNQTTWARALKPQAVVYSSGTLYGHPHCAASQRYRDSDGLLPAPAHPFACSGKPPRDSYLSEYVTQLSGVIQVTTDGSSFEVTCEKGKC